MKNKQHIEQIISRPTTENSGTNRFQICESRVQALRGSVPADAVSTRRFVCSFHSRGRQRLVPSQLPTP